MSSQFSIEYLQHLSQTQPSQNLNKRKLICPKCKTTKFKKNLQGHLVCIHGHELPHYRTEVSEEFDPTFSNVVLKKKKKEKSKELKKSIIDEIGENRKILVYEAFQFILKKQIEILQIEMNFPAELSDIVRDIWIMYVTATKVYYMRKEAKENKDKSHAEDEEIDRILKEAGVSDSDIDSDSDSGSDLSSEDSETDYSDASEKTVLEDDDDDENEGGEHTSKKLKTTTSKSHKKKRKAKKHKIKTQEEMIEDIHKHITSLTKNVPLVKLSVIFLYMGCLWLRLPVMISDFHTWIVNEDIPYFSAIYCVPYKIKKLLTDREAFSLKPNRLPSCEWLYSRTAYMIHYYETNFKLSFPPINYPVIACRMLSILALPAEAYLCLSRLIQLIKIDFSYNTLHDYPLVDLLALIIIVVKFIYGLDNEKRVEDEFCKNFYPLDRWIDCLLQRRKEYDTHGLPIYENDYLSFINNNEDKFVEYCQKTFIDRYDSKDQQGKFYKIFKDIAKFIRRENQKKNRNHRTKDTDDDDDTRNSTISSSNSDAKNENKDIDVDVLIKTISGFKALPKSNKHKKKYKSKKESKIKESTTTSSRNSSDEDHSSVSEFSKIKSTETAASITAIITGPLPKKKCNRERHTHYDDTMNADTDTKKIDSSNNNNIDNNNNENENENESYNPQDYNENKDEYNKVPIKKRKYPGEHYVTYRMLDPGGEYHTTYAVVLHYCQDVILRINNDLLQNRIGALESSLFRNEFWLEEYFKQDKFISSIMEDSNNEEITVSTSRKKGKLDEESSEDEESEDEFSNIFGGLEEEGIEANDNDNDQEMEKRGEEEEEEELQEVKEGAKTSEKGPEIEVVEDSEDDSEEEDEKNRQKKVITFGNVISHDEEETVEKDIPIKNGKMDEEENEEQAYTDDLIETLMKYEEQDEIEYPYY